MGKLAPALDLSFIPAEPRKRKWPCRGGTLEKKIKMGVRKIQTLKHTKTAMAKHLLGLIEWQISTAERKCNPCLGFVLGFLNHYENEASSQIPVADTPQFVVHRGKAHISFSPIQVHDLPFPHHGALWSLTGPDYTTQLSDTLKSLLQAESLLSVMGI